MIFNIKYLAKKVAQANHLRHKNLRDEVDLEREEAIWVNETGRKVYPDLFPSKVPVKMRPSDETMVFDKPQHGHNTMTSYDLKSKQMEQEPDVKLLRNINNVIDILSQIN